MSGTPHLPSSSASGGGREKLHREKKARISIEEDVDANGGFDPEWTETDPKGTSFTSSSSSSSAHFLTERKRSPLVKKYNGASSSTFSKIVSSKNKSSVQVKSKTMKKRTHVTKEEATRMTCFVADVTLPLPSRGKR